MSDYTPTATDQFLLDRISLHFGTEESSRQAFEQILWPNGFHCRRCSANDFTYLPTRDLHECKCCKHQQSLTAGTAMHRTQTPLATWAALLFCHANPHIIPFDRLAQHFNIGETQRARWKHRLTNHQPTKKLLGQFLNFLHRSS